MILKLERLDRESGLHYTDICYVWINTTHIETYAPRSTSATDLTMASGAQWLVGISPDELAAAIDPENACPDPAGCTYRNHYLVYGPAELTHGGWHAAELQGQAHFTQCGKDWEKGVCLTCTEWERRLRA